MQRNYNFDLEASAIPGHGCRILLGHVAGGGAGEGHRVLADGGWNLREHRWNLREHLRDATRGANKTYYTLCTRRLYYHAAGENGMLPRSMCGHTKSVNGETA